MKKSILIIAAALSIVACNKDKEPTTGTNTPVKEMSQLKVNQDFDWSNSKKGQLEVSFSADTTNVIFDGEEVQIVDNSGKVIAQQIIQNNKASFYYMMPAQNVDLYVYYPNTRHKVAIDAKTSININVPNLLNADYETLLANATSSSNKKTSYGTMADLVINGGFDNDNNFANRPAFPSSGIWYVKKTGNSNHYALETISGSQRFKSNNNRNGYSYQWIPVNGGDLFTHTANTSGNFCSYLSYFDSNLNFIGYVGYAPNNQDNLNASGTIPASASFVELRIHGPKNEWIDNVTFDVVSPIQDADNDGVADNLDAYPNDVTRAYNNPFPTSGFQTLAFEDLWPFTGDYDFNDMVISNQGQFVKNGALDLVEVTLTASLDAVGSGFQNGLGVVFLDANKQPIAQNMIASVSGDATLDPNVTNGIIVFNDVYQAQSAYYQNNNVGPSKAPDTFTYTVTFNSNAGNRNLIPDTYIFRTLERGLEVHVPGFVGTSAADAALNNTGTDVNGTYKTATGLPWALELITTDGTFKNPNEKIDITQAYPKFQAWAESNGAQELGWLDSFVSNITFGLL